MALERVIGVPKKGIGESTLNQIYTFGKANKLCLEDLILKLIEKDNLKPKVKTILQPVNKHDTKNGEKTLNMKHFDLLKLVLDGLVILAR